MKRFKLIAGIILFGVTLSAFQNCGKAGFEAETENSSILEFSTNKSSIEDGAPFAFQLDIDTIAYNSCAHEELAGKDSSFIFRGGAFQSGGVKIKKEFIDYAKSKLKPSYPHPEVTLDQIQNLLNKSKANQYAQIQFSLRTISNMQSYTGVIYPEGTQPTLGADIFQLLPPLSDPKISNELLQNSLMSPLYDAPFQNYFSKASPDFQNLSFEYKIMDAELYNETQTDAIRELLSTNSMLTLTYHGLESIGDALTPNASDPKSAYGLGFKFSFNPGKSYFQGDLLSNQGFGCTAVDNDDVNESRIGNYWRCDFSTEGTYSKPSLNSPINSLNPSNILTAIDEFDLATSKKTNSQWVCDPLNRFVIVRPSEQDQLCPKHEDPINVANLNNWGTEYYTQLEMIRRVLPADQWDVNLSRRCAVPKDRTDCYHGEVNKDTNKTFPVEYDLSKPCFQRISGIPYAGGVTPIKICAQHISICTKK